AASAGVDETGGAAAIAAHQAHVADAVVGQRPEALSNLKFPLEDLPTAAYGAERVALDDVDRRVRRERVATSITDLPGRSSERLVDGPSRDDRSDLRDVPELGIRAPGRRCDSQCYGPHQPQLSQLHR